MTHVLKCWPESFDATWKGRKTHEFRRDDRGGFDVGDVLILRSWDPNGFSYSGRAVEVRVTHITKAGEHEMPEGYCAMSIRVTERHERWAP